MHNNYRMVLDAKTELNDAIRPEEKGYLGSELTNISHVAKLSHVVATKPMAMLN